MNSERLIRSLVPRAIRNFLRAPDKAIQYMGLSAAYSLFGRGMTCTVRGDWEVRCHPVSYSGFKGYESRELKEEVDAFVRHSRPGMVLLDIGSHYGFFSLAALHYGAPDSKVIAADPSPETGRIFLINLKLNGVQDRVRYFQAAVGNSMQVPMLTTGAYGEHMLIAADGRPDAENIKGMTMASMIEQTGWYPTHIKIDVEGYEGEVLEGGREYLAAEKPVIFMELHAGLLRQKGRDPQAILKLLHEIGYRFSQYGAWVSDKKITGQDVCRFVCLPLNSYD